MNAELSEVSEEEVPPLSVDTGFAVMPGVVDGLTDEISLLSQAVSAASMVADNARMLILRDIFIGPPKYV